MENKIGQVMCLANGKKYVVMKQAVYKGNNYFVAALLTEDEEDVLDEIEFFQSIEVDGKESVQKVKDKNLIELISKHVGLESE